jgi:ribose transport system ATP-binding protein
MMSETAGTTPAIERPEPLLRMEHISKSFPGVIALSDAQLTVLPGEVHALIGQNGAGKSTLIKILTGAYHKDTGTIWFDGHQVAFRTPLHAQANGLSTIYQEINLVPYRSVAENVFMGREPRRLRLIDWREMNRRANDLLGRLGIHIDVTQPLLNYSIATQQMVAIARAASFDSKLVIMDEPTSSLDDQEVATLFGVIRRLKSEGVSVIFITHRLDELYEVCDRVTIMRDGRTIETCRMEEVTKLQLVARMLGKELGQVRREGQTAFERTGGEKGRELLEVENIQRGRVLRDASVDVRSREIVGLAGLLGSGRTEVAKAVFGADPIDSGEIRFEGRSARFRSPADAIKLGIGLCPEDRKGEGIVPALSVRENLSLAALPLLSRHGIVDKEEQARIVDRFIERLGIRCSGPEQPIRELSGGNQQKVLLARWLCLNPKLLILDEPTRGIDVGAKAEIQALIDELADEGLGVLMISSEIEELTEGADRVIVLSDGRTIAELPREQISQDAIMTAMAAGGSRGAQPATASCAGVG